MGNKFIKKTVRFSETEFTEIEQKLIEHQLTFSEYARSALLDKKIHSKNNIESIYQNKKIIEELNRIGNNINQIAKSLNSARPDISNSIVLKSLIDFNNSINALKNDS